MPQAFLLQDWITVRGNASTDTVIQSKDGWLDLGAYVDVVFYADFSYFTGTNCRVVYSTSASGEDGTFSTMASYTPSGTGLNQQIVRFSSASVPLARYVRWEVDASSSYAATFRIWVCARPG